MMHRKTRLGGASGTFSGRLSIWCWGRRYRNTFHKYMSEFETLTQHSKEALRARSVHWWVGTFPGIWLWNVALCVTKLFRGEGEGEKVFVAAACAEGWPWGEICWPGGAYEAQNLRVSREEQWEVCWGVSCSWPKAQKKQLICSYCRSQERDWSLAKGSKA